MAAARRFGVARIVQRRDKIFLAFAFEFFLRGPEVCNARCDFLTLLREAVVLFGHAHPFESCPVPIGVRDWGANWEQALQDCDRRNGR
jgi:hypothetical protein